MDGYANACDEYLETSVLSSPPEKLRLMLLDLALQNTNQAIATAKQIGRVECNEYTLTLRETLNELLAGIAPSSDQLPHQVADLYVFLLNWLTTAENTGELEKLNDVQRVLNIEHETWTQLVSAQFSTPTAPSDPDDYESVNFDA